MNHSQWGVMCLLAPESRIHLGSRVGLHCTTSDLEAVECSGLLVTWTRKRRRGGVSLSSSKSVWAMWAVAFGVDLPLPSRDLVSRLSKAVFFLRHSSSPWPVRPQNPHFGFFSFASCVPLAGFPLTLALSAIA